MDTQAPLPQPNPVTVANVVRRALGRPAARLVSVGPPQPLTDLAAVTNPMSGGVFRLRGVAVDRGEEMPWSVILKVLRSPAGWIAPDGAVVTPEMAEDGTSFNYWRREALAFQTGLLAELPPGVAAPRCLDICERGQDQVWLWLEDLASEVPVEWDLERYALAARHLGEFNGAYLAGRPLPDAPWLSRGYLRGWLETVTAGIDRFRTATDAWRHPLMQAAFPADTGARLQRLWGERETLLDALGRLPRTFAHLDAFRANLFARSLRDGSEQTLAIDWAWAGQAAIGEEIGPLVVATIVYDCLPPAALPDLENAATEGYLAGLARAGWDGDPTAVRLGYQVSAALRYAHLLTADVLRLAFDDGFRAATEARHGRPFAETAAQRATLVTFLLDRAEQARALVGEAAHAGERT